MWYQLISDIGARYFPLLLQTPVCVRNVCAFVWGHYIIVKLCSALGPRIFVKCSIIFLLTERPKAMNFEYWDPWCYIAVDMCVIISQFKTKCKSIVVKIWYIQAPPCVRWKLNWLHLYFSYFLQGHICISPQQLIRISRPGCNAQGCKYLNFFSDCQR